MSLLTILDQEIQITIDDLPEDFEAVWFCAYINDELQLQVDMNDRCVKIFNKTNIEL